MENEITTQGTAIVQEPTIMVEEKPMFAKPTITAENQKDRVSLLKKILTLHKRMRAIKWEPDGHNRSWNHDYFTAGLIKSNFQKACIEAELVFMLDIARVDDLAPTKGFNIRQRMNGYLTLIDIDTGATFSYPIIGEAGDSGDKCSAKLVTMTIKSAIATNFAVADIDPEFDIADNFGREAKQEDAKNTLRNSGQNRPATTKAESKAKTPTKAQKPVEGKETAKDRSKPQDAPVEMVDDRSKPLTSAQKNAMSLIYNSVTEKAPEGFDLAIFEDSFKTAESGGTRGHAEDWINQYKGMMK